MSVIETKCINCGHPFLVQFPAARSAPDGLDAERLARALPDWMVEHPIGRTEAELRRIIAGNIIERYTALEPLTPSVSERKISADERADS